MVSGYLIKILARFKKLLTFYCNFKLNKIRIGYAPRIELNT